MKKKTDDLLKSLKNKRTVEEYFEENDDDIFFGDLKEQISHYLTIKKLDKSDVVRRSNLDRVYCYQIMNGTKKPKRDKLIMLCFGLDLNLEECQHLLKTCGYAPLYPRNTRDSIIIFSIEHKKSLVDTNIKLSEYALEILE